MPNLCRAVNTRFWLTASVSLFICASGLLIGARTMGQDSAGGKPTIDLFTAVLTNNTRVVTQHIENGTSLDLKDPIGGNTGLSLACVFGHVKPAQLLMDAGANLETRNNEQATPLYLASFFAHPEIVACLLEKNADPTVKNQDGVAVVDLVETPWSAELAGIYRAVFSALGIKRDLDEVKQTRPEVAKLLRARLSSMPARGVDAQQVPSHQAVNLASQRDDASRHERQQTAPAITEADWATYNHDLLGWRYNRAEKRLNPSNAHKLTVQWQFPSEESKTQIGAIHATPAVVNGYVYFGTATFPAFYKLTPDGKVDWVYHTKTGESASAPLPRGGRNLIDASSGILASALVTNSAVFFGDSAGVFYALDRFSGRQRWRVDTRAPGFPGHHPINIFNASAILADGKVIVGGGGYEHPYPLDPNYDCCTGQGFVVALDPEDGSVVWKYDVGEKPQKFTEPVVIEDAKGKHVFKYGPSTSSVWSTPSYDTQTGTIFFGTDVHNSPRKPTQDNPRYDTDYSAAVVAVDVATGREKWVTQLNPGDVYNHSMAGYKAETGGHKDGSVGDTPKIYTLDVEGKPTKVVGVGCKNGGFYVLRASDGKRIANTPIYTGPPTYPLNPQPHARMLALPSLIGGLQTGCATDGEHIYTNGIDWISINSTRPKLPDGGRVVSVSNDLKDERWRHERPKVKTPVGSSGDPVAAGIALGGGLACFAPTVSEQLVVLNADTGQSLASFPVGTVWSGPSISRGRIYVGTGSILFLKKQINGTLYCIGLSED